LNIIFFSSFQTFLLRRAAIRRRHPLTRRLPTVMDLDAAKRALEANLIRGLTWREVCKTLVQKVGRSRGDYLLLVLRKKRAFIH
jgi:hypothetical protein